MAADKRCRSADPRGQTGVLFAASLGFAVVQFDVSVVNVAIKPIGEDLGGGVGGLQWVISAYIIAFASLILTAGAPGDRIAARRVHGPRSLTARRIFEPRRAIASAARRRIGGPAGLQEELK